MTEYPDVWKIVKIVLDEETVFKVFSGWYGGYLGSDSWKVNSGIVDIKRSEDRTFWEVTGYSGTVYVLHDTAEKWNLASRGIFSAYKEKFPQNIFESSIDEARHYITSEEAEGVH